MDTLFLDKLIKNEYISMYIYNNTNKNIIPSNFDLNNYNNRVINHELIKYKEYFDTMYSDIDPNISLDDDQRRAILSDEDFSLIIAGAGTGKTTTMASKVKFLVDKRNILPSEILVMSYTKKATQELEKRICIDFNINAQVTTFHSLGLMHIREIFSNRKCYVIDTDDRRQIFYQYFKEEIFPNKEKIKEIVEVFFNKFTTWLFGNHFLQNYNKYNTFDEYFRVYKKDKISEFKGEEELKQAIKFKIESNLNQENISTLKRELVKSKGEAIIANFLAINGIDYQYEKIYEELMEENRVYKPDFTINYHGREIYVEYFGLINAKETPTKEIEKYKKIKEQKENYHKLHKNLFISILPAEENHIIEALTQELTKLGVELKPLTNTQIYDLILDTNPLAQIYNLMDNFYKVIDVIKSSQNRENYCNVVEEYLKSRNREEEPILRKQFMYINNFYQYYQKQLYGNENYGFDFSDLIYYANKYITTIRSNSNLNFKYIIIDEYQDISQEKYLFTKSIADKNKAKVVAVGDDWQSIYSFSGSKVDYIYNFQRYFKDSKLFKINNTYRNSQSLIDYSGKFIMRNESQIKKNLHSSKQISNPVKFTLFKENDEYKALKDLILRIHSENKDHKILILARTNKMIDNCFNEIDLKDDIGNKITYIGYEDIMIEGMTIHKSKGLTSDEVIVIGLNKSFPSNGKINFWLEDLFRPRFIEENIPFAEERRIFYVALTRTKNYVHLLTNENPKMRSEFVDELAKIIIKNNQELDVYKYEEVI